MQLKYNWSNLGLLLIAAFFSYLVYILWTADRTSVISETMVDLKQLISYSILSAYRGAHGVRTFYKANAKNKPENGGDKKVKGKTKEGADEFVTSADLISNALILETLKRFPGVKIVSEEKDPIDEDSLLPYRSNAYDTWQAYRDFIESIPSRMVKLNQVSVWVDPLDATQEYTEDLLHYVAVMLCITVDGKPVFGVVTRPFEDEIVWGLEGIGVTPDRPDEESIATNDKNGLRIIVSRSHSGKVKEAAYKAFTGENITVSPAGGAGYKILRVLNNTADMYMHVTAIKKWDLCAGHAILSAAGGRLTDLDGNEVTYFAHDNVKLEKGLLATRRNHFTYLNKLSSHKFV